MVGVFIYVCYLLLTNVVRAEVVKVGPWGGSTGTLADVGPASRIRSIRINHGDVVDRLTVYYPVGGTPKELVIGGIGGLESKFELGVGENITGMSGSVNVHGGITCVAQLYLTTSRGITYGPYGRGGGIPLGRGAVPFSAPRGNIVNFFGRGGYYVYALGAYLEPN